MTRGVRGATTVSNNDENQMINNTKVLVEEMITKNNLSATDISHVFISVTKDLNAGFPAKSLRKIEGWKYVPVMCMTEIDVPGSLSKCIRVMMVANITTEQTEVHHIFHNEAVKLRPDLIHTKGE